MCIVNRSIGRTPWFIAYDAEYDSVVISIRGTWSLKDVVTDILAGEGYPTLFNDRHPIAGRGGRRVRV